jgi:hypothetical protein
MHCLTTYQRDQGTQMQDLRIACRCAPPPPPPWPPGALAASPARASRLFVRVPTSARHARSLSRSIQERRASVAVLLCGTSGTGKSTLAGLLASRLGITTVVSTDSVRAMMRSFDPEKDPLLWASTYEAGACMGLPPATEADGETELGAAGGQGAKADACWCPSALPARARRSPVLCPPADASAQARAARQAAVRGYKAQSEMILQRVERRVQRSTAQSSGGAGQPLCSQSVAAASSGLAFRFCRQHTAPHPSPATAAPPAVWWPHAPRAASLCWWRGCTCGRRRCCGSWGSTPGSSPSWSTYPMRPSTWNAWRCGPG